MLAGMTGRRQFGIRSIVAASLLAVLACVAGQAVVSFTQLQSVDQAATSLRSEFLPAMVAAENLARKTEQLQNSQATLLLDIPEAMHTRVRQRAAHLVPEIDAAMATLENGVEDEQLRTAGIQPYTVELEALPSALACSSTRSKAT